MTSNTGNFNTNLPVTDSQTRQQPEKRTEDRPHFSSIKILPLSAEEIRAALEAPIDSDPIITDPLETIAEESEDAKPKPKPKKAEFKFQTPAKTIFHGTYTPLHKNNGSVSKNRHCTPKTGSKAPAKVQCTIELNSMRTPVFGAKENTYTYGSNAKSALRTKSTLLRTPLQQRFEDNTGSNPAVSTSRTETLVVNGTTYEVLYQLGKGGSSVVFCCFNPELKTHRAIKCVTLEGISAKGYLNEVKLLQSLQNCSRIIKMYDFEIQPSILYVVLELGGSDLSKILKHLSASKELLPTYKLIYYWMEMLHAVKQIHQNGVIHADLKPANFLPSGTTIKLIDFGIACKIQNDMTSVAKTVPEGSFEYVSPEAIAGSDSTEGKPKYKISCKSDVWSLGCILYELVYRRPPFHHIRHSYAKLSAIVDPHHVIEYPEATHVPLKVINTIKSCLRYDGKARCSINDLIAEYDF